MRIRTSFLFLITGVLIIGNIQIAYGNGRTPRQPISPLKAICSQRSGNQIEIFRVRLIFSNYPDNTLSTLEGLNSRWALTEIQHIEFLESQITTDDFMEAKITPTYRPEISTKVRVRSGGLMIRLTGFSRNGDSVSIDLSSCKTVEFSR